MHLSFPHKQQQQQQQHDVKLNTTGIKTLIHLNTISDRYCPVLIAGKKSLNCNEVTPPLKLLLNHFNISIASFSITSGLKLSIN